jgi:hypothetical protein
VASFSRGREIGEEEGREQGGKVAQNILLHLPADDEHYVIKKTPGVLRRATWQTDRRRPQLTEREREMAKARPRKDPIGIQLTFLSVWFTYTDIICTHSQRHV